MMRKECVDVVQERPMTGNYQVFKKCLNWTITTVTIIKSLQLKHNLMKVNPRFWCLTSYCILSLQCPELHENIQSSYKKAWGAKTGWKVSSKMYLSVFYFFYCHRCWHYHYYHNTLLVRVWILFLVIVDVIVTLFLLLLILFLSLSLPIIFLLFPHFLFLFILLPRHHLPPLLLPRPLPTPPHYRLHLLSTPFFQVPLFSLSNFPLHDQAWAAKIRMWMDSFCQGAPRQTQQLVLIKNTQ